MLNKQTSMDIIAENWEENNMRSLFLVSMFVFIGITVSYGQVTKKTNPPSPKVSKTPEPKPTKPKLPATPLSLQTEILNEINLLRMDPSSYVKNLEILKATFQGDEYTDFNGSRIVSIEGVSPVVEAISVLKTQKPVKELKLSEGMSKSTAQHVVDMSEKDFFAHKGSDGSFSDTRANRFGGWSGNIRENLASGSTIARDIVMQWVIDDGVKSRGHRKNLLDPNFRIVGIWSGNTPSNGYVTVVVFANAYIEKGGIKKL
jgi:uncharacterized protein YkwD